MDLFFLRHGKAYPRGPRWQPDSKRPLTREGEANMFDVARGIRAMEDAVDVILTSPFARALRTAEILAEVYKSRKPAKTENLTPEAAPAAIINEINQKHSGSGRIVLVGHEPSMSLLISTLLTGQEGMEMELKKAGLCKLTARKLVFGQCACLQWLLTPRQMARMH